MDELRALLGAAGCRGTVCVESLDGAQHVSLDDETPMVAASVVKVLVALEAESQFADGILDPTERCVVSGRTITPGPVGLSLCLDDAELSMRDLVTMMLTISDNAATDVIIDRVGLARLNEAAHEHGLTSTFVEADLCSTIESIALDAGFDDYAELSMWLDAASEGPALDGVATRIRGSRALDPATANRTTAHDMTRLLRAIWRDEAAAPAACSRVRSLMAKQLTRHRVAAGFPAGVSVAAKSGGLMGWVRNEVGVVRLADGATFCVAIFTVADEPWRQDREINAAIGAVARRAVEVASGQG